MRLHILAGACLTAVLFSTSAVASSKHHKRDYGYEYNRYDDINRDGYIGPRERRIARNRDVAPVTYHKQNANYHRKNAKRYRKNAQRNDYRSERYQGRNRRYSDGYISADIRPYGVNRIQVVFPW